MKNLLLFSTLLLATSSIFAQLTVKPTASNADSYVYVSNQFIYVKNGVDLTRNLSLANAFTDSKEASIYLRNNGQLIQGNDTANTGDGQLSVQQNTPVTNSWAYYYWCSPIGKPRQPGAPMPPGNQNFGVGLVYEALPALSTTAAVKTAIRQGNNGSTNPVTISTRWLYTFTSPGTEREGNYSPMYEGFNAPAGYGFTMKGVGPILEPTQLNQTYEFRGRPNNGTFSIEVAEPVLNLPNPDPEPQMTLAGNPYPSALDLNQLFYDGDNEELGAIWYYDEDRTVASHNYSQKPFGYGVWVPGGKDPGPNYRDNNPNGIYTPAPFSIYNANGGSTPTDSIGGSDQNKRYAPIGQGLMFVGKNEFNIASDSLVKIKNSHRIYVKENTPGSIFQRPEVNSEIAEIDTPVSTNYSTIAETARVDTRAPQMRIWTIFNEAVTRDMVLAFYDEATDGYDRGLDGLSAQDLRTDAYFLIGDDTRRLPYVINGVQFNIDKQIPIAFKLNTQTKFDVKVVQEIKKPYVNAYIFDAVENTYMQITRGQSATYNLPAGTYDNRFFIVFLNPNLRSDIPETELAADKLVTENVKFFQNNPNQQLEVRNPEGYIIKAAAVYDMGGKLVISENNLGNQTKFNFYTGNLSSGVYLVKLITENDVIIDYKAIVHNQ